MPRGVYLRVKERALRNTIDGLRLDDCDKWVLDQYALYLQRIERNPYVLARKRGEKSTKRLARIIVDCPDGFVVDHINGDHLDNRRENLRICTVQQNNWNRARRKGGTSKYKGVTAVDGKFQVIISPNKTNVFLGFFDDEEAAARAYDAAARLHYGEYCAVNFPMSGERCAVNLSFHEAHNA